MKKAFGFPHGREVSREVNCKVNKESSHGGIFFSSNGFRTNIF